MLDEPTIPGRIYTRPTAPIPAARPPRARGTDVPPPGVAAITQDEFEALCWYAPPLTTPLAWFAREDGYAIGLVLRDHMTTTFSVVSFLVDPDGFALDQRRDGLEERWVAVAELLDQLGQLGLQA